MFNIYKRFRSSFAPPINYLEMTTTKFSPTLKTTETSKLLTLAAGCFWGVERVFKKQFGNKGIVDIKVGYANGEPTSRRVTYELVCAQVGNFVESIQISYEPSQVSAKELIEIFFRMHDPTQSNAQGPDKGVQYRSAILLDAEEDVELADQVKAESQKTWYPNHKIVTVIEPIKIWYDAEDYHQRYLDKNPGGYECPLHFIRTKAKV